jgi:DNA-directed RNA polymerase specialized sigma24 family protein
MSDNRNDQHDLDYIETDSFRSNQHELANALLDRSAKMDSKKQALLWMILEQGASYSQIGRLSGEHASTVSRRFHGIIRRLRSRPLDASNPVPQDLPSLEKTILIESLVYGASQKQIAAKLGISRYRVRKALNRFHNS